MLKIKQEPYHPTFNHRRFKYLKRLFYLKWGHRRNMFCKDFRRNHWVPFVTSSFIWEGGYLPFFLHC